MRTDLARQLESHRHEGLLSARELLEPHPLSRRRLGVHADTRLEERGAGGAVLEARVASGAQRTEGGAHRLADGAQRRGIAAVAFRL